MKKLSYILMALFLLPLAVVFTGCGELKVTSLNISVATESATKFVYDAETSTITVPHGTNIEITSTDFVVEAVFEDETTKEISVNSADAQGYSVDFSAISAGISNLAIDSYTITFAYQEITKNITLEIVPTSVTIPTLNKTHYTYTGEQIQLDILNASNAYSITLAQNFTASATAYTATLALVNSNFVWSDGTTTDKTLEYYIDKANYDLSNIYWNYAEPITYSGIAMELTINEQDLPEGVSVLSYANNIKTNVGEYTAQVTFTQQDTTNYNIIDASVFDLNWEIIPAELAIPTLAKTQYTYTGSEVHTTFNEAINSDLITITHTPNAVNVRQLAYKVTLTLTDKTNYVWAGTNSNQDVQYDYYIVPAELAIPTLTKTDWTYTGSAIEPTFSAAINSNLIAVAYDAQAINVGGPYQVTLTLQDTTNYVWSDSTTTEKTIDYYIIPAELAVPTLTKTNWEYTGTAIEPTFTEAVNTALISVSYDPTAITVNSNPYQITLSLTDKTNYVWATTQETDDLTVDYYIVPAKLAVPTLTKTNWEYTGLAIEPTFTEAVNSDLIGVSYDPNAINASATAYQITLVLEDKNNYVWESTENTQDLTIDFYIVGAGLATPTLTKTEWEFSRSLIEPTFTEAIDTDLIEVTYDANAYDASEEAYQIKLTLKNPNYVWQETGTAEVFVDFYITKALLAVPVLTETHYVYTGDANITFSYNEFFSRARISEMVEPDAINVRAEPYILTLSISDFENYGWADGTETYFKEYQYYIIQAEFNVSALVWNYSSAITYTGEAQTVTLRSTLPTGTEITYVNNATYTNTATEIGSYTAKATFANPNYNFIGTCELDWEIVGSELALPVFVNNHITYTGETIYPELTSTVNTNLVSVSYPAQSINASETAYSITYAIKDKTIYSWVGGTTDDITLEYYIDKADYDLSNVALQIANGDAVPENYDQTATYTYNGEAFTVSLTGLPSGVTVASSQNVTATNAGSLVASFTFAQADKANYNDIEQTPYTQLWTIAPILVEAPVLLETTKEYTGEEFIPQISAYDGEVVNVVRPQLSTNAGSYDIYVNLLNTTNYNWSNGTTETLKLTYTITPITLANPTLHNTEFRFCGVDIKPSVVGIDTIRSFVTLTYPAQPLNASNVPYEMTVALKDTTNYVWANGTTDTVTLEYKILPMLLEKPTLLQTEYPYTGSQIVLDLSSKNGTCIATPEATFVVRESAYTATISLTNTQNYVWADTETTEDFTLEYRIIKADINLSNLLWNNDSNTYNGSSFTNTIANLPNGVTASYENNTQTNAGIYTTTATLTQTDLDNYNALAPEALIINHQWQITKARVAIPELAKDEFTATGEVIRPEFSTVIDGAIIQATYPEDAITAKNEPYYITLSLINNANYAWAGIYDSNRESADINVEFYITLLTFSAEWDYTSPFEYNGETYTVELIDLPEGVSVVGYTNNTASEVGTYTAEVTLQSSIYALANPYTLNWQITPKAIAKPILTQTSYDFTGERPQFVFSGFDKDYMSIGDIVGGGSVQGVHYVEVCLNSNNYVWMDGTTDNLVFVYSVDPISISLAGITTDYDPENPFVYEYGTQRTVHLNNIPGFINLTYPQDYEDLYPSHVGTYKKVAQLNWDAGNISEVTDLEGNCFTVIDQEEINKDPLLSSYITDLTVGCLYVYVEFEIIPQDFELSNLSWDYYGDIPYDGKEHVITIANAPGDMLFSYTNNVATAPGGYKASATVQENENYNFIGNIRDQSWNIISSPFYLDDISTYVPQYLTIADGNEKTLSFENLGSDLEITLVSGDDSQTEPGTYNVTYQITLEENSSFTEIIPGSIGTLVSGEGLTAVYKFTYSWTISKQDYLLDGYFNWYINGERHNHSQNYQYTGEAFNISTDVLPEGLSVNGYIIKVFDESFGENGDFVATDSILEIGDYQITPIFVNSLSYYNTPNPANFTTTLIIEKRSLSLYDISWNYNSLPPFVYDGTEKSVYLVDRYGNNQEDFEILSAYLEYSNNKNTEIGTYTATALIKDDLAEEFYAHYEIWGFGLPTSIEWQITQETSGIESIVVNGTSYSRTEFYGVTELYVLDTITFIISEGENRTIKYRYDSDETTTLNGNTLTITKATNYLNLDVFEGSEQVYHHQIAVRGLTTITAAGSGVLTGGNSVEFPSKAVGSILIDLGNDYEKYSTQSLSYRITDVETREEATYAITEKTFTVSGDNTKKYEIEILINGNYANHFFILPFSHFASIVVETASVAQGSGEYAFIENGMSQTLRNEIISAISYSLKEDFQNTYEIKVYNKNGTDITANTVADTNLNNFTQLTFKVIEKENLANVIETRTIYIDFWFSNYQLPGSDTILVLVEPGKQVLDSSEIYYQTHDNGQGINYYGFGEIITGVDQSTDTLDVTGLADGVHIYGFKYHYEFNSVDYTYETDLVINKSPSTQYVFTDIHINLNNLNMTTNSLMLNTIWQPLANSAFNCDHSKIFAGSQFVDPSFGVSNINVVFGEVISYITFTVSGIYGDAPVSQMLTVTFQTLYPFDDNVNIAQALTYDISTQSLITDYLANLGENEGLSSITINNANSLTALVIITENKGASIEVFKLIPGETPSEEIYYSCGGDDCEILFEESGEFVIEITSSNGKESYRLQLMVNGNFLPLLDIVHENTELILDFAGSSDQPFTQNVNLVIPTSEPLQVDNTILPQSTLELLTELGLLTQAGLESPYVIGYLGAEAAALPAEPQNITLNVQTSLGYEAIYMLVQNELTPFSTIFAEDIAAGSTEFTFTVQTDANIGRYIELYIQMGEGFVIPTILKLAEMDDTYLSINYQDTTLKMQMDQTLGFPIFSGDIEMNLMGTPNIDPTLLELFSQVGLLNNGYMVGYLGALPQDFTETTVDLILKYLQPGFVFVDFYMLVLERSEEPPMYVSGEKGTYTILTNSETGEQYVIIVVVSQQNGQMIMQPIILYFSEKVFDASFTLGEEQTTTTLGLELNMFTPVPDQAPAAIFANGDFAVENMQFAATVKAENIGFQAGDETVSFTITYSQQFADLSYAVIIDPKGVKPIFVSASSATQIPETNLYAITIEAPVMGSAEDGYYIEFFFAAFGATEETVLECSAPATIFIELPAAAE